ncbi:pantoate--beta-alanine ligase [Candidatus Laterigemmans baculatus]|uniref:pantoate--beta-alanine ligase n=1 Tax=Candidatus Laterigemmans baculatus TaxID=2770505 RepID=UPI0013DC6AD4|nr:pantoate--beta-alanine ligase [Candidatus Laterigemmans baculatus]
MQILKTKDEARRWVRHQAAMDRTSGLVPTMGALHEGHYSLVRHSLQRCDSTIATIFVNPTQFAPHEDLSRYPRPLEEDLAGLAECGADAVFVPEEGTMYAPGHSTFIEPPAVARPLEGACREGHFRGVATVVLKLMHILPTTHAFFGQKDFQQAAVISAMVRDLDMDVEVEALPTVREPDGLALSSRNRYLSSEQRSRALGLSRALRDAADAVAAGEIESAAIEQRMHRVLTEAGVDAIEYAVIADRRTLERLPRIDRPAVALIAARVGTTRLIDNQLFDAT